MVWGGSVGREVCIQGKADLNAVFPDGTTRTAATFEFNSGPYGNGLPLTTPMKRLVPCQQMKQEC